MKRTLAAQIVGGGALYLALLGVTTGAAFPQTINSENPTAAPAEAPAPAAVCQPIGLTASGEIVFPIHCKDFIARQKNADQKTAPEGNQKPTVADKKPDATEEKTAAKRQETAAPENGRLASDTIGTVPLPRARERIVGPPGCTHFHSYDPASGTYRPYDGKRRPCRDVTSAATPAKAGPAALRPDSSKAPLQPAGSAAATDTNATSANVADPRSTADVDAKKSEADAAPAATAPDSSKAPLPSVDSTAAADTNATSANVADAHSTADVDARKTEGADAAPATTAPDSSKAPPPPASSTAAEDTNATSANISDSHSSVDVDARKAESADAALTTTSAEHSTVATAAPTRDIKAINADNSDSADTSVSGNAEKTGSVSANGTDHLVAVLLARPDITSVSGLTGKTIAIDDKYSASNGSVRIAIVAAGASEIELSAGQTTALSRLIKGEVPAAILALLPAAAAEEYPEIAGFQILRIPLSPRS